MCLFDYLYKVKGINGRCEKNQLVEVGKVTIPANHDVPISGRILEVQYLYVNGKNGALFQPVYKGDRSHELEHKECHTGQLVYKKVSDAA